MCSNITTIADQYIAKKTTIAIYHDLLNIMLIRQNFFCPTLYSNRGLAPIVSADLHARVAAAILSTQ